MSTFTTLTPVATRPALVKTPMSEAEYLALGETKHDEYFDGMCVVNPPSIRHQRAEAGLFRLLDPLVPPGYELLFEWGWRTGTSWFRPDLMIVPSNSPADIARDAPLLIVEILSPANRLDLDEPSVLVLQLVRGVFIERQQLTVSGSTVGPVQAKIDPSTLA